MKLKEKVQKATMTLEEHEQRKKTRLKRFLIASFIIFGLMTSLSFLFFTTCEGNVCNTNYISILNIIIISFGIIGLIYCFLILKDFNEKIDDKIMPEYKQILLDDEKDNDNKLSFENKDNSKKLICF